MVADSVEGGILPSNAQHGARSAENAVKANKTDPRIVTRNSMRWTEMMALMTGMVLQPIKNLDEINLTIIMTLFV